MIRDKGHFIAGAGLACFAIYVIAVAGTLPYASEVGPGPGFFPLWLGIGMALMAACLMSASAGLVPARPAGKPRSWKGSGRALAGWLALLAAIFLLGKLGFGLSFFLLTIFLIVALDRRPATLAAGVAFALAVAFYLIFAAALDVSLPKTPWGF